jgi:hypothetical protein
MSDLEAKSLSTPEKIFRQKILENFLGKNFSRKFVKFLSGWKNFQKSCQEKLSDIGKNCCLAKNLTFREKLPDSRKFRSGPKNLLAGEKFDIPGKNCQIPKISVRTEKFDIPGKNCQIPGKVEISGKSGKVALLAKFSV